MSIWHVPLARGESPEEKNYEVRIVREEDGAMEIMRRVAGVDSGVVAEGNEKYKNYAFTQNQKSEDRSSRRGSQVGSVRCAQHRRLIHRCNCRKKKETVG